MRNHKNRSEGEEKCLLIVFEVVIVALEVSGVILPVAWLLQLQLLLTSYTCYLCWELHLKQLTGHEV